jgi:pimeloyl-ACP methyl ester carboxylesterase
VLLLQGELDTFVTGQAHLLDVIPDSRRVVMDGIGAFLFYEAPEEIAKVVDEFIEGS